MWVVRRSCSCLIVGRWVDLCLGRFGGVIAGAEQTKVSNLLPQVVSNNSENMITHLSSPKQAEKSTGEEERCPEAPILFNYPKEAYGQSALETSVEYDLVSKEIMSPTESMQLSLKGTRISEVSYLIQYWQNFITCYNFKRNVLKTSTSSIMHLFCPISAQKGTGTMESLKERENKVYGSSQDTTWA